MLEKANVGMESLVPPERLTNTQIDKIVKEVDDPRLDAKKSIEFFLLDMGNKIVNIPKRSSIDVYDAMGGITSVKIGEYIKGVIDKHDELTKGEAAA